MAQRKAHEVDAFIAKSAFTPSIILVYGPDRGLVSERVAALKKMSGVDLSDPFSISDIDMAVQGDPDEIANQAYTIGMFGGSRLIHIRNASNDAGFIKQIERLIQDPPADTSVLIEAGDLKKNSTLRTRMEKSGNALALPCYADDERAIHALIENVLSQANQTITMDARQFLMSQLGGDRRASRNELEKLVMFSKGRHQITIDDVTQIMGDSSSLDVSRLIDAVIDGQLSVFDASITKLGSAGIDENMVLMMASRQFQQLELLRAQMDNDGKAAAAVVAAAKPPIFYSRKKTIESALRKWTPAGIAGAQDRLQKTVLEARQNGRLGYSVMRMALLALTVKAHHQSRRN